MAGPSIAKAEVTVDLDGKRLPAEAKALGEQAGRAMGEAHNEAFGKEIDTAYGDLREQTIEDLKRTGQLAGDGSGKEFSQAFRNVVTADAHNLNRELADIFGSNDGLDRFYAKAQKSGDAFRDIELVVDRIDDMLLEASDNGSLNAFQLDQASREAHAWADGMREVVQEHREVQKISLDKLLDDVDKIAKRNHDAADEADLMKRALHDVNETRLNNVLDDLMNSRLESERTRGEIHGLGTDIDDLRHNHILGLANDLQDIFEGKSGTEGIENYRERLQNLRGSFVGVDEVVRTATEKIDAYEKASGRSSDATDHFRGALRKFESESKSGIVDTLGNMVRKVDDLGDGFDRSGKKSDGFSGKMKSLIGLISRFDPADNMGQLFLIILAFAGPAAVLVSALGAQIAILGTAAFGAIVGVAGFALAFQGMTGDISKLPKAVQPAAEAFQKLKDPLLELQDKLQVATFKGMADNFDRLGDAIPKLGPGVEAIGRALNGFLSKLSDGISKNIGPINELLEGFAPIIDGIGSAVVNLIGVFGGLFKAAMPFAQEFASSLEKTTGKWSDWINSIEGQKALQKWFADAKPVMDALGGVLGDAATAFSELITEDTKKDLLVLIDDIGRLLISLGKIGGALSPAVTAVIDLATKIGEVIDDLSPVIEGIGKIAQGVVDIVTPVLGFLDTILGPIFETIGAAFDLIGSSLTAMSPVWEGVWGGLGKAIEPIVTFVTDIYKAVIKFIDDGIKIAQPAIDAFGQTFSDLGEAIGEFLTGIFGAAKDTDGFKDTAKNASDFLDGPFKKAIKGAQSFFEDLSSYIKNTLIPTIREIDWKKVTDGMQKIIDIIPDVIDAIVSIAKALTADITAWGAWAKFIGTTVSEVSGVVKAVAKVVDDVLRGDFGAAAADGAIALEKVKDAGGNMQKDLDEAFSKTRDAVDQTKETQNTLAKDWKSASDKMSQATKDFRDAGKGNLTDLTNQLGYTGKDAGTFRAAVEEAAKKSGVSLSDLAKATSLPDLEKKLGLAGTSAQQDFEKKISAAAQGTGAELDKLPPKAQAIISKLGVLGDVNSTPKITLTGDTTAIERANAVKAKLQEIDNLPPSVVTIITKQVAQGTAAVGGIMAGGQLVAGGQWQFAGGGVVSAPTTFGNVLTGESGLEAIVPLSRPISQIDPSVRALAEYAQGLGATNKEKGGAYFAPGAVVVSSPSENPAIVASQVVDRLVTQF